MTEPDYKRAWNQLFTTLYADVLFLGDSSDNRSLMRLIDHMKAIAEQHNVPDDIGVYDRGMRDDDMFRLLAGLLKGLGTTDPKRTLSIIKEYGPRD